LLLSPSCNSDSTEPPLAHEIRSVETTSTKTDLSASATPQAQPNPYDLPTHHPGIEVVPPIPRITAPPTNPHASPEETGLFEAIHPSKLGIANQQEGSPVAATLPPDVAVARQQEFLRRLQAAELSGMTQEQVAAYRASLKAQVIGQ
jgi:hypothetical protein